MMVVQAASTQRSNAMSGRLYLSETGWLLLSVPNAIVRGTFDAMNEPGIELPRHEEDAPLNAHISVMSRKEVEEAGDISERGHMFQYSIGALKVVSPSSMPELSRAWMLGVSSLPLQRLRKSYGLSAIPHDGKQPFHITVAVRRTNVLRQGDVRKVAQQMSTYWQLGLLPAGVAG